MLKGKRIILGITGGIAAYKSVVLLRLLQKAGADVQVVVTKNALQFVTKLTLQTLSGHKVYADTFNEDNDYSTEHVALADWADLCIVAPATANIIGKMAGGIADDALSTLLMAFNSKLYMAPAMNTKMFENPLVQKNIATLKKWGVDMIGPESGMLACGVDGKGVMTEPTDILKYISEDLSAKLPLKGKSALVTAGPTHEPIDDVRYIGNYSSGKMGFAVAEELATQGAKVTLVAGPVQLVSANTAIKRVDVSCADEMFKMCMKYFPATDITVMAAAVADFTPSQKVKGKIKKNSNVAEVALKPTKDILASMGNAKKKSQILVGFALECSNELENAISKLNNKNLDLMVLNSLNDSGAGFGHDTNKITLITSGNKPLVFPLKSKTRVATDIVSKIIDLYKKNDA